MHWLLLSIIGLASAAAGASTSSATSITNRTFFEESNIVSDLCNPVIPYCDGAWTCSNTQTTPSYHHTYGMICNTVGSTTITSDVMCPLGGTLGADSMCQYVGQQTSWGCPDFAESSRTSSGVTGCVYKYPPFCPHNFVFVRESNMCMAFQPATCVKNTTDCGYYFCDGDIIPRYIDRYSTTVPICVYGKYPAVANDAGYLECLEGEALVDKYCYIYGEALYKECSPTATFSATPSATPEATKELPSRSPFPTPSETPAATKEMPSSSSFPTPSETPAATKEMPSRSSFPTPSATPEATKEIPSRSPFPTPSATPTSTPSKEIKKPSESETPTPLATREPVKPSETGTQTPFATREPIKPSESETPSPLPTREPVKPSETGTPTPFPTREVQKPSESETPSPYPSREPVKPSETGTPTPLATREPQKDTQSATQSAFPKEVPSHSMTLSATNTPLKCDYHFCPDRMEPSFLNGVSHPVCIYRRYWATVQADGLLGCPDGGQLIGEECILFEPSVYVPCTPTSSVTPAGTSRMTQSSTSTGTGTPTGTSTSTGTPAGTPRMTQSPTGTPTGTGTGTPISTPRASQNATVTGTPTGTSTPSVKPYERPSESMTPAPTKDVPRESPSATPSPSPSREPVQTPTITATITIEIKIEGITNATTGADLAALQNTTVIVNLRDAIAKALGVSPDMVIIESLTWIENGNVRSTVRLNNSTGTGGRRLQSDATGLDIKYKVVNPPAELMTLPPEQFATIVETSPTLLSSAAAVVSVATGVEVTQELIVLQSTEMVAAIPEPVVKPSSSTTNTLSAGSIGGIVGGISLLVGFTIYYTLKRERRRRSNSDLFSRAVGPRIHPVQDVVHVEQVQIIDGVAVVNPIHNYEEKKEFELVNTFFSPPAAQSTRYIDRPFPPQQARRATFDPTRLEY